MKKLCAFGIGCLASAAITIGTAGTAAATLEIADFSGESITGHTPPPSTGSTGMEVLTTGSTSGGFAGSGEMPRLPH